MSKALSLDLRLRVLAAVDEGASHRQAAERFGVGAASVSRWRALEELQLPPEGSAIAEMLADYAVMREQAKLNQ